MRLTASHGIKVILNGQGADETLAGYPSYFGDYWSGLLAGGRIAEAWGEIAHTLYYNEKDLMVTDHVAAERASNELWRPQLNSLKAMVDACSQQAGLIEQSKRKVRQLVRNRDRYASVTDLKG